MAVYFAAQSYDTRYFIAAFRIPNSRRYCRDKLKYEKGCGGAAT